MNEPFLHKKYIKKALNKSILPDLFTISCYRFSPYMACSHGCAYCDGRAERYYIEGDFDRDIIVRENIHEILIKELSNVRLKGPITISSGVTDAYQPVEETLELTRKCLEVLTYFDFPVMLLTKSPLIERDLDLLGKLNKKNPVTVYISLIYLDDKIRQKFEPKAGTVDQRLELISKLKDVGCNVGVLAMPFLPFICDSEQQVTDLLREVIKRGADFAMPGCLTIRPGRQKEYFFQKVNRYYPQYLDKYKEIFSNNLESGVPIDSYLYGFDNLANKITIENNIDFIAPHHVFRNILSGADELYVLLYQLKEVYDRKGIDTKKLKYSIISYGSFLKKEKKDLGRNIAFNTEYLNKLIPDLCRNGKINNILKNDKLSTFVSTIFLENRLYDFTSMKIIT